MWAKFLLAAALFFSLVGGAAAQNPTCPTRPTGDNTNACASTAFTQNTISSLAPFVAEFRPHAFPPAVAPFGASVGFTQAELPGVWPSDWWSNGWIVGGQHVCLLNNNCYFYGDFMGLASIDPTMTTQRTVTNAVNSGGVIRLTVDSTSGLSNGDKVTASLIGGYPPTVVTDNDNVYTVANLSGLSFDLQESTWNGFYSGGGGRVTYGAADVSPYISQVRIIRGRTPQFDDAIGMWLHQCQTTQNPNTNQPCTFIDTHIVDPDEAQTAAQSRLRFGVASNLGGVRATYHSMQLMQGLILNTPAVLPGGLTETQANLQTADKGFGTVNVLIDYFQNNASIGRPAAGAAFNLATTARSGNLIDIAAGSITLRGPQVAAGGAKFTGETTTTVYDVSLTINTSTTGANGLDPSDGSLAASTGYNVFLIYNPTTGLVRGFASTNPNPTPPAGYTYKAQVDTVYTTSGAALLDSTRTGATYVSGTTTNFTPKTVKRTVIAAATTLGNSIWCDQNIAAGGNANYTITVSAASGFVGGCRLNITNADAANTKTISPSGLSSFTLQALESIELINQNGTWFYSRCVACTFTSLTSPLIIGGTGTGSTLTLESTSGVGATDQILFKTGSQTTRGVVTTGGRWGFGTETNPQGGFIISSNATTGLPSAAGAILQAVAADSTATIFDLDAYGQSPSIAGRAIGGTAASPTATTSGTILLAVGGGGYDSSAFTLSKARLDLIAAETFSATAQGTRFDVLLTKPTTTTRSTVLSINGLAHAGFSLAAPTVSSCGTTPGSVTGTDTHGTVTEGTTATGCTITFANAYTSAPQCVVQITNVAPGTSAMTYTVSTTAITVTNASASGDVIVWHCLGT